MTPRVYLPLAVGLLLLACASAYEDPVDVAVGIAGDKNAEIIGTLDEPLTIRCLAYGYPTPEVFWIHDRTIVPFIDPLYLARGNELLIRRLAIDTLGEYKCQAYNGKSTPVSWVVAVKAYRPVDVFTKNKYLVSRTQPLVAPVYATTRKVQPTAIMRTRPITELPVTYLNMPVVAHIQPPSAPPSVGGELSLVCEIDGFPDPEVYWTKDNTRLYPGDRNTITGSSSVSRLTIVRLAASDAGLYGCHVKNDYSIDTATTQITIKQDVYVPPRCTDNPYFAKCSLIVRNNFCRHKYYGNFCCKSCVEAGQIAAEEAMQADQPSYRRK